jgi:hypothetical protein
MCMINSIYYSLTCLNEEGHEFMIGQTICIYTYQQDKKNLTRHRSYLVLYIYSTGEVTDDDSRK